MKQQGREAWNTDSPGLPDKMSPMTPPNSQMAKDVWGTGEKGQGCGVYMDICDYYLYLVSRLT
jgi:hypothetical protein